PEELAGLIADMYDTLDAANGVGLAANQVGKPLRLFVYDCPDEGADGTITRRRGAVINPVLETSEIPETMPDPDDDEEGCLSVPGEQFPTGRADWA
ncbi:peptide deformylase, partial [Nocardia cyriacigeorgica]